MRYRCPGRVVAAVSARRSPRPQSTCAPGPAATETTSCAPNWSTSTVPKSGSGNPTARSSRFRSANSALPTAISWRPSPLEEDAGRPGKRRRKIRSGGLGATRPAHQQLRPGPGRRVEIRQDAARHHGPAEEPEDDAEGALVQQEKHASDLKKQIAGLMALDVNLNAQLANLRPAMPRPTTSWWARSTPIAARSNCCGVPCSNRTKRSRRLAPQPTSRAKRSFRPSSTCEPRPTVCRSSTPG